MKDHRSPVMPAHAPTISGVQAHTQQRQRSQASIATDRLDKHEPVISSIISSFDNGTTLALPPPHASKLTSQDEPASSYNTIIARATSRIGTRKLRRSISLGMGLDTFNEAGRNNEPSLDPHGDGEAAEFPVIRTTRGPAAKTSRSHGQLNPNSLKARLRSGARESNSSLALNAALDTARLKAGRSNSSLSSRSTTYQTTPSLKSAPDDEVSLSAVSGTVRPLSNVSLSTASGPFRPPSDISLSTAPGTVRTPSPLPPEGPLRRQSPSHERDNQTTLASVPLEAGTAAASTNPRSRTPSLAARNPLRALQMQDTLEESDSHTALRDRAVGPAAPTTLSPASVSTQTATIGGIIPPRKSSLDQTSSPPRQRQRSGRFGDTERKKRQGANSSGRRGSKVEASKVVNTFAGLDEHDATMKRIKELKQIKQDRLTKESAAAEGFNDNTDHISSTDANPIVLSPVGRKPISETLTAIPRGGAEIPTPTPTVQLPTAPSGSRAELINNMHSYHTSRPTTSASSRITSDSIDSDLGLRHTFRAPYERSSDSLTASRRLTDILKPLAPIASRLPHGNNSHKPSSLITSSKSRSLNPPLIKCDSDGYEPRSFPDISLLNEAKGRGRRSSMNDVYYSPSLDEEELQERRRSVVASVDAYLNAPRLSQRVRCPKDGRLITFSEVGDPAGAAVIVCVGMGLTRYVTAFYDELAATLGLRLITLDRPGVGGSEPYPERERIGPLSWPDDVLAVTQHLRISRFSLLAHSAGAIYALATALTLPHRVRGKVHLLAPWIPPSQFDTFGIKDRSPDATPVGALPRSQRLLRVLPIPFLKAANGGLFSPASIKPASVKNSPASSPSPGRDGIRGGKPKRRPDPLHRESLILMDQVLPERPVNNMFSTPEAVEDDMAKTGAVRQPSLSLSLAATASPVDPDLMYVAEAMDAAEHSARERQIAYSSLLTEQTWTMATRNANAAVDLIVCLERHRDIGFRYVDIQRQIVIVHGSEDKRVPVENVRWIGEQINRRAATNRSPGDKDDDTQERGGCEVRVLSGEGHGLMASPAVMMDVLADISNYWKATKR